MFENIGCTYLLYMVIFLNTNGFVLLPTRTLHTTVYRVPEVSESRSHLPCPKGGKEGGEREIESWNARLYE